MTKYTMYTVYLPTYTFCYKIGVLYYIIYYYGWIYIHFSTQNVYEILNEIQVYRIFLWQSKNSFPLSRDPIEDSSRFKISKYLWKIYLNVI